VPPLRARKDDIPLLVDHFVRKYSREFKRDVRGVARSALPALAAYDWPGNVRELENIIERSVALATHPVIQIEDLPLELALHEAGVGRGAREPSALSLKEARDRFEQAYVLRALEHEDWNQSRAARRLGVHRNTLIARLAAWGIRTRDRSPAGRQAAVGERGAAGSGAFGSEELL
jgi:DNA-binding NtrC family response regulator